MSDAVRRLLGPQMQHKLLTVPLAQGRCPVCHGPLPPAGPVNVVISVCVPAHKITFAHLACAPSELVPDGELDLTDMLPDVSAMNMETLMIVHGNAELPVLAAERPLEAYATANGAELTDLLVATLLHEGLALVPRLREAPRRTLDWTARLTRRPGTSDHLIIESVPGTLFYDGDLPVPPDWWEAVERYGWCVLYGGNHLGRGDGTGVDVHSLKAAAAAGNLVGGRLRITRRG